METMVTAYKMAVRIIKSNVSASIIQNYAFILPGQRLIYAGIKLLCFWQNIF